MQGVSHLEPQTWVRQHSSPDGEYDPIFQDSNSSNNIPVIGQVRALYHQLWLMGSGHTPRDISWISLEPAYWQLAKYWAWTPLNQWIPHTQHFESQLIKCCMTNRISSIISLGKTVYNLHISAECHLRDTLVSCSCKKGCNLPQQGPYYTHYCFQLYFLYTCLLTIQCFLEFRGTSNDLFIPSIYLGLWFIHSKD